MNVEHGASENNRCAQQTDGSKICRVRLEGLQTLVAEGNAFQKEYPGLFM